MTGFVHKSIWNVQTIHLFSEDSLWKRKHICNKKKFFCSFHQNRVVISLLTYTKKNWISYWRTVAFWAKMCMHLHLYYYVEWYVECQAVSFHTDVRFKKKQTTEQSVSPIRRLTRFVYKTAENDVTDDDRPIALCLNHQANYSLNIKLFIHAKSSIALNQNVIFGPSSHISVLGRWVCSRSHTHIGCHDVLYIYMISILDGGVFHSCLFDSIQWSFSSHTAYTTLFSAISNAMFLPAVVQCSVTANRSARAIQLYCSAAIYIWQTVFRFIFAQ